AGTPRGWPSTGPPAPSAARRPPACERSFARRAAPSTGRSTGVQSSAAPDAAQIAGGRPIVQRARWHARCLEQRGRTVRHRRFERGSRARLHRAGPMARDCAAPGGVRPDRVASLLSPRLTLRTGPRTVPITRARLMEMRIIPGMRVGRAAHDARPPGVESAEVALRRRGLRVTAPRQAVLEVVRSIKTHPTAEEVHRLVIR